MKHHPENWNLYLSKHANAIRPELSQSARIDALKLATLIVDIEDEQEYFLTLPVSRLSRMRAHLKVKRS